MIASSCVTLENAAGGCFQNALTLLQMSLNHTLFIRSLVQVYLVCLETGRHWLFRSNPPYKHPFARRMIRGELQSMFYGSVASLGRKRHTLDNICCSQIKHIRLIGY